jgi:putative hydrolase of the HAD superfamily
MPHRGAIIFDFGNVIAFFDHGKACRQLAELSTSMDAEAIYAAVFNTTLERDYDSGRISTVDFLTQLRQSLSLRGSDEAIGRAWSDIFTPNESITRLIPDLKRRGVPLVLGSNTNALHHEWFGRLFDRTLALFDAQVLSYRIGCCKPDPRFYEACIAAAGRPASSSLYIDDRADFVAAGRAYGMNGIVYTPDSDLRSSLREVP